MNFSPLVEDRARGIRSGAIRSGELEALARLFLSFEPSESDPETGRVRVEVKRNDERQVLGYVEGAEKAHEGIRIIGEPWDGLPIQG